MTPSRSGWRKKIAAIISSVSGSFALLSCPGVEWIKTSVTVPRKAYEADEANALAAVVELILKYASKHLCKCLKTWFRPSFDILVSLCCFKTKHSCFIFHELACVFCQEIS